MKFRDLVRYDDEEKEERKALSVKWAAAIFFGIFALLLNFLAIIYITKSEYIYFWDNATYWDISKQIANGALMPNPFKALYESIGQMDYNYLAGLVPAAFMRLFGNSRLVYVLTLVNAYLLPAYILIYLIAKKLGKAHRITFALIALLNPVLIFLTFNGFADIGALDGCLLCFYWYCGRNKGDRTELWKYFAIGAVLVGVMLWRRWYAFFSLSFITAMFADCIINRKKWYPVFISAGVSAILLAVCFNGFTINILLRNYGSIYSSYKFSPMMDFKLITRYFGLIYTVVLFAASSAAMIRRRDFTPMFMWVQIIVCLGMFIATQTHGQQHLLLYVPSLITLTVYVIRNIKSERFLIAIILLAMAHTVSVFIPRTQPNNIQEIETLALAPNFSLLPRYRADVRQMLYLKLRLDEKVGVGEKLGVVASSFTLNEDILRNAEESLGIKQRREDYICTLPQVDSRDYDYGAYNRIDYALVAMPSQTHLAAGEQTVIDEAVREFSSWDGIGTAFEEVYDFSTQIGGMDIKLFKRVRDIPEYVLRDFAKKVKGE